MKKLSQLRQYIKRYGLALAEHAEHDAWMNYVRHLGLRARKEIPRRKLHIYSIRINREKQLVDGKPCSTCREFLIAQGFRKVTYSTQQGTCITELLINTESRPSVGDRSIERSLKLLDQILGHDHVNISSSRNSSNKNLSSRNSSSRNSSNRNSSRGIG